MKNLVQISIILFTISVLTSCKKDCQESIPDCYWHHSSVINGQFWEGTEGEPLNACGRITKYDQRNGNLRMQTANCYPDTILNNPILFSLEIDSIWTTGKYVDLDRFTLRFLIDTSRQIPHDQTYTEIDSVIRSEFNVRQLYEINDSECEIELGYIEGDFEIDAWSEYYQDTIEIRNGTFCYRF
jgi:hypothetical protein